MAGICAKPEMGPLGMTQGDTHGATNDETDGMGTTDSIGSADSWANWLPAKESAEGL